ISRLMHPFQGLDILNRDCREKHTRAGNLKAILIYVNFNASSLNRIVAMHDGVDERLPTCDLWVQKVLLEPAAFRQMGVLAKCEGQSLPGSIHKPNDVV